MLLISQNLTFYKNITQSGTLVDVVFLTSNLLLSKTFTPNKIRVLLEFSFLFALLAEPSYQPCGGYTVHC